MKMKASAGVGMALSPDIEVIDINTILEGRILLVRLILHGIKLSAFCAPTATYEEASKQAFFNTLQKSILNVKKQYPGYKVIIGADMNATIGCDSNGLWSYLGTNNDNLLTNDNGTRVLSLSEECKLYIMDSLYGSTSKHRHTWYSPTGFTKRIDYILTEWYSPTGFTKRILTEWHIKKLSSNCLSKSQSSF